MTEKSRNIKLPKWAAFIFWAAAFGAIFYLSSQNENSPETPEATQPDSQSGSPPTPSQQAVPSIIGQRIFVKDIFDARLGCPHISDLISFYGSELDSSSSSNSNSKWIDALADAFRDRCVNFNPGDTGLVIEQFPIAMPQNGKPILVNADLVRMDGTALNLFMLDYFVAPIKP